MQGNVSVTCPSMALSMPLVRAPEMTCPAAPIRAAEASPDMAYEDPHFRPDSGSWSCIGAPELCCLDALV